LRNGINSYSTYSPKAKGQRPKAKGQRPKAEGQRPKAKAQGIKPNAESLKPNTLARSVERGQDLKICKVDGFCRNRVGAVRDSKNLKYARE